MSVQLDKEDYFGRMSHLYAPSAEVQDNAEILLTRVNALLAVINESHPGIEAAMRPRVNSGWRPAEYNATVPNAAPRSKHITGQAIDIADPEGELDELLLNHPSLLEMAGLWLEHPLATKGWSHWQCVPPRSGNRVFYP